MKADAERALAGLERLVGTRPRVARKAKVLRIASARPLGKLARLYVAGRLFCQWW